MGRKTRSGTCRICRRRGKLDRHHIISQHRAKKINREELITNPGNIVLICRKCHSQTTSYLSRYKYKFKGEARDQEIDVLIVNNEGLNRELTRLREKNSERVNEIKKLAEDEVSSKESEIGKLQEENQELKTQLDSLEDIAMQYNDRVKELRKLAEDEISSKESEIGELEEENQDLKTQMELIDKISLEYQVSRASKKVLKQARKDLYRVSREIEDGIIREVKGAVKTAKKVGSGIRKKTGL